MYDSGDVDSVNNIVDQEDHLGGPPVNGGYINISDNEEDPWEWPPVVQNEQFPPSLREMHEQLETSTTTAANDESCTQCSICLNEVGERGVNLHNHTHPIHLFCLLRHLINSPGWTVRWSNGSAFTFNCPVCRGVVQGSILLQN